MTTYKRLGDYIREVNVRNRELKVTKLAGCEHFEGVYASLLTGCNGER